MNKRITYSKIILLLKYGEMLELVGRWDECIEIRKEAYFTAKELGNNKLIGIAGNYLGYIYSLKNEYEKANTYFEEALSIFQNTTDAENLFETYGNLGAVYFHKNNYDLAMEYFQKQLEIFKQAINNVQPLIEVRSRRVGGATYQVPTEVRPERRIALAMRWIKSYASQRGEKTMSQRLSQEIISASNGEGSAVKKKDDTHKMAEANKAFAHFKW